MFSLAVFSDEIRPSAHSHGFFTQSTVINDSQPGQPMNVVQFGRKTAQKIKTLKNSEQKFLKRRN